MLRGRDQRSFQQTEIVVDLAVTLTSYTESIELCRDIPAILSRPLGIDSVILSLIGVSKNENAPQFLICSAAEHAAVCEVDLATREHVLSMYRQFKNDFEENTEVSGQSFRLQYLDQAFGESGDEGTAHSRTIVFAQAIDAMHFMILIMKRCVPEAAISIDVKKNLCSIAYELAKQLQCLVAWQDSPKLLGEPFSQLTAREWIVLRRLNSDLSEKELAIQLGLSPHTLHSYIRSIYHKIGVQGRVPLLLRLNCAHRHLRVDIHKLNGRIAPTCGNMLVVEHP